MGDKRGIRMRIARIREVQVKLKRNAAVGHAAKPEKSLSPGKRKALMSFGTWLGFLLVSIVVISINRRY
jgi:hypothetical protein